MKFETVLSHASTALAWVLSVLLVVNLLARRIPTAAVLRLETASPRAANALRLCRAIGPDLDKALRVLFALVTGRPWVVPVALAEPDRPTDPPGPPKPPSPPAATPSAGLLALLVVCVLACGPHPWHVTARATINAHAHALAAADAVLAQAIASDPSTDPEAIRVHWERAVHGLRIAREFLVTAESGVLAVAGTESEPEKCRALKGVEAALGVAVQSLASLSSVGVQVPGELREATAQSSTLSELALRLCRADGGGL